MEEAFFWLTSGFFLGGGRRPGAWGRGGWASVPGLSGDQLDIAAQTAQGVPPMYISHADRCPPPGPLGGWSGGACHDGRCCRGGPGKASFVWAAVKLILDRFLTPNPFLWRRVGRPMEVVLGRGRINRRSVRGHSHAPLNLQFAHLQPNGPLNTEGGTPGLRLRPVDEGGQGDAARARPERPVHGRPPTLMAVDSVTTSYPRDRWCVFTWQVQAPSAPPPTLPPPGCTSSLSSP